MDNGYIQYNGRRKSRFKIGNFFREVKPQDILELPMEYCADMCRNHRFRPFGGETKEAIKFYITPINLYEQFHGMLTGKRCFIVGRGSSLKGFDYTKLNNEFVITINESIYACRSDITVFCDSLMWKHNKKVLDDYEGFIFSAERTGYHLESTNRNIIPFPLNNYCLGEKIQDGLYCGASSGMIALNLALIMGAEKIYLLGFDLDPAAKKVYADNKTEEVGHYRSEKWTKDHYTMFTNFAHFGDRIVNLNSKSKILTFPFGKIEDVL
jgi:hypothetical protein